jgi:hypothetical protein
VVVTRAWRDAYNKNYYTKNRDAEVKRSRTYRNNNTDSSKLSLRKANLLRRLEAYSILGGRCSKCGSDDPSILQFNHINNDGALHRKLNKVVDGNLARWIILNPDEAKEKIELLCAPCHAKLHSGFTAIEGTFDELKHTGKCCQKGYRYENTVSA